MLEKGTTFAGYRVDGTLGRGGMGTVYEATQLSLNRTVALKLLAPHLSDDVAFRARFQREGQIQAGIDHSHIVTIFEAGESEHGLFIAMRLVRGPHLKAMIVSRELDAGRSLRILTQVADALDAAHGAGLIHRDIKPQNILVGGRDHAFLADFGLTKAAGGESLTKTGQFVGTLDYISPEQIQGERATNRSDIYAVGAVLYECLTGVVPFPKESEAAVLYAHMADPPPRITEARPELPPQLDQVIEKAMAKDPGRRHASASELIRDAERTFGKRVRAAFTPPGPLEVPEETGIRAAEGDVSTREAPTEGPPSEPAYEPPAAEPTPPPPAAPTPPAPATVPGQANLTRGAPEAPPDDRPATEEEPGPSPASGTRPAVPSVTAQQPGAPPEAGAPPGGAPPEAGPTRASEPAGDPQGTTPAATRAELARAAPAPPGPTIDDPRRLRDEPPASRGQSFTPLAAPDREREGRATGLLSVAGAILIALLVVGFLVGRSGGSKDGSGNTRSASAGGLQLSFPDGWRQSSNTPRVPGLEFAEPIAWRSAGRATDGQIVAGQVDASGPTLLPRSFRQRLDGKLPRPEAVRLGKLEAYRYAELEPHGLDGKATLYTVPTTKGVATVACTASAAGSGFLDNCERVAASLKLTDGDPYPIGPDEEYGTKLLTSFARLNSAHAAGLHRLSRAKTPSAQGRAAAGLAASYERAARRLATTPVSPAAKPVNAAVVRGLRATAAGYRRMARAALGGRRASYNAARRDVRRGEATVRRSLKRLKALGYD